MLALWRGDCTGWILKLLWPQTKNHRSVSWPWRKVKLASPPQASFFDDTPIIKLSASTLGPGHGGEGDEDMNLGANRLLGYKWCTKTDTLSTNKASIMNLHPAWQGRRPEATMISEVDNLLKIHKVRPLRYWHALAASHGHFKPLQSSPQVQCQLKYMYRTFCTETYLDGKDGGTDYDKELSDDFVIHHLGPALKTVLAAKQLLTTKRSWRILPCISYQDMRIKLDAISDGCWGVQAGSATIWYLIQRYIFQGEKRVHIYIFLSATSLNPLTKISH